MHISAPMDSFQYFVFNTIVITSAMEFNKAGDTKRVAYSNLHHVRIGAMPSMMPHIAAVQLTRSYWFVYM